MTAWLCGAHALLPFGSSIIGWSWDIPKFRPPFNNVKQRPHTEDTLGNLILFLDEAACNDEAAYSLDLTLIRFVTNHDSEGGCCLGHRATTLHHENTHQMSKLPLQL